MRKFLSLGLVVAVLAACAPNAPQNGPDQDGRLSLRQSSEIGRVGTYLAIARADAPFSEIARCRRRACG
jgi:hypothetical protein